jgi:two-component system, sensor histidine kinase
MNDPAATEREMALARECAYLRRKIERLQEQRLRQERIDDINRHFLKKSNEKLVQYQERSHLENLAKSDFLANMSHEIRTPLNIILGMANLLADTELDLTQAQYLHSLRLTGRQLLDILNNILEFSRIEAGKVVVEREPFSLHETIAQIESSALPLCLQKNLYFSVSYDKDLVMERVGDPVKIFQVLLNLVNNAIKFTLRGTITLELEEEPGNDNFLMLRVIDTGVGIPFAQQRLIFDRFTQGHDYLAQQHGGAGLGLAISQKLTRAMGGDLNVQSAPGVGSTFSCRLPLPTATPAESHLLGLEASPVLPENCPAANLLVVDDIRENINVIQAYLRHHPIQVDSAENGQQALHLLADKGYDLVLMDIRMPTMDGITATREIRRREQADPGKKQQVVVAITAHAFQEQKNRLLEEGFNGVLSKPFFKKELLQTISRFLGDKARRGGAGLGNKAIGSCFERQRLEELPAPLRAALPEILAGIARDLELLQRIFAAGDYPALSEKAHALKGLAGMYGFGQLAQLIGEFSDSVRQGNSQIAEELLKALTSYLHRLPRAEAPPTL